MEDIKKLIKQTILVNHGLKGKYIDRLVDIMIGQMIINELDNYLDIPYIEEMLYAEDTLGNQTEIDGKFVNSRPNLDHSEEDLKKKYQAEFKLLESCLTTL